MSSYENCNVDFSDSLYYTVLFQIFLYYSFLSVYSCYSVKFHIIITTSTHDPFIMSFYSNSALILISIGSSSILISTWCWSGWIRSWSRIYWPSRGRFIVLNASGINSLGFGIWSSYGWSSRSRASAGASVYTISSSLAIATWSGV